MKLMKWAPRAACTLLACTLIVGAALASGDQGSQQNPLVTLSYLDEVVVPEILKQVDEKLETKAAQLQGAGAAFTPLELSAGRSVTLAAGSQLLVRAGNLSSLNPLVDLTEGTTWNGGEGMKANHLYIATGEGQTVTACTVATVMVQGGYTLN